MRYSEITKFSESTSHIFVDGSFNDSFSYGQNWDDIPFPSVKHIAIKTGETFTRGKNKIEKAYSVTDVADFFGKTISMEWDVYARELTCDPTWLNILENLDQLVGDSGDMHHRYPEDFTVDGDTLFVTLGS
jgi:hypothetical protein